MALRIKKVVPVADAAEVDCHKGSGYEKQVWDAEVCVPCPDFDDCLKRFNKGDSMKIKKKEAAQDAKDVSEPDVTPKPKKGAKKAKVAGKEPKKAPAHRNEYGITEGTRIYAVYREYIKSGDRKKMVEALIQADRKQDTPTNYDTVTAGQRVSGWVRHFKLKGIAGVGVELAAKRVIKKAEAKKVKAAKKEVKVAKKAKGK